MENSIPTQVSDLSQANQPSAITLKTPNRLLISLLVSLFLSISVSTLYLFYQNLQLKKQIAFVAPIPSISPNPSPDSTTNWKTYTSDKYKFSIRYPREATIVPNEAVLKISIPGKEFPPGAYVWVDVLKNPQRLSLPQLGNKTYGSGDEETEWKGVSFLDQNAFMAEYAPPGDSGPTTIYLFEKDGLVFSLARSRVEEPNSIRFTNLTAQILFTFRFLDQNSDHKTACESNGGIWNENYQECGRIKKDVCEKIGGTFDECASPCRHDPNAKQCVTMCAEICAF